MHRARKSLGQNFLIDPNIQQKIVDAVAPGPGTDVLEIGPGTGALTHRLAGRARRLTAIELDHDLARALEQEFHSRGDVRILHGDVLDLDVRTVTDAPERLTIVGNIPYNI
ncbi:MAG TPA: rRNA adenine N-6-methyltransferase family protein, partial [Gaiellaceae bacterium]|nr:rRNA adenine N-6-methyltransferase family protein [Gaiellaceae bacterium]